MGRDADSFGVWGMSMENLSREECIRFAWVESEEADPTAREDFRYLLDRLEEAQRERDATRELLHERLAAFENLRAVAAKHNCDWYIVGSEEGTYHCRMCEALAVLDRLDETRSECGA